ERPEPTRTRAAHGSAGAGGGGGGGAGGSTMSIVGGEIEVEPDDTTPDNENRFTLELMELGLGNPVRRRDVIEGFKRRFARLWQAQRQAFYATVLHNLRMHPGRYGVEAA